MAVAGAACLALLGGCESLDLPRPSPVLHEVTLLTPLDGFRVLGSVRIKAEVAGDEVPSQVDFLVDGELLGTDTASPWEMAWETDSLEEGTTHVLQAVATDGRGLQRQSATATVEIGERTFTGSYGLFTINSDGTNLRPLVLLDFLAAWPEVAPDAVEIVFTGYLDDRDGDGFLTPWDEEAAAIHLVNADGTGLRRLNSDFIEEDARWSVNGGAIFFATNQSGSGQLDIFERYLIGTLRQNKTATPGQTERFPVEGGSWLYYSRFAAGSDRGTGEIWKLEVSSHAQVQVTDSGITGEAADWFPLGDCAPDVSPDGGEIAFSRAWGTGAVSPLGRVNIVLRDLADGLETELTSGEASDLCPRYSPDGERILVTVWDDSLAAGGGLALLDRQSGERTFLGPWPADLLPLGAAWFPGASPPDTVDADPDIVFAGARASLLK